MQRQINRGNKSVDYTLPAPIGGLNVRDSLDTMEATDAIVLDNYIPLDTKLALRKGYAEYFKGDRFRTLAAYKKYNEPRLIGIAAGKAWNLTSKQLPVIYDGISFMDNRCQTVQYKDYLYFMNGADTPKAFHVNENGDDVFENWGFSAEGLIPEKIVAGAVSKQFLWFVEKGSMKVWYSAEGGNIAGSLYSMDFSQVSKYGGHLVAVCNWTVDGGTGIDDLTVFITSEGEVLVYAGSNPNSAADWTLKGSYKIARPIGYQCTLAYQGDIVIISEDGYLPLTRVLPLMQAGVANAAFSDKIRGLVLERSARNSNKDGWQGIVYPRGGYALFNVPAGQQFEQHVINTNTGAWCRFTNIRAYCWCLFEGRLYFGSDYGVYLFDEGNSDAGTYIYGEVQQAFSNLGSPNLKKIQLLNPRVKSSTAFALTIYTNMDFEERKESYVENIGNSGLTKWNEAPWSCLKNQIGTKWQTLRGTIRSEWVANSATGFKASIVFKTKTRGNLIEWHNTGIRYEHGRGIL